MPEKPSIRVLIVDDEPLARQRLSDLLEAEAGVEIVGTASDGRAAVDALRQLAPDVVFLDIQMPGLTGLEVVQHVGANQMPVTIFVTAYDQYAIQAFDVAALDYLVKPFDDERFEQAFARARQAVRLRDADDIGRRLARLLQGDVPPPAPVRYLERIAVEMRGQLRVVPVEKIDFISASGPYAELHVGEDQYVIRERMQTLEDRLDPAVFFRIHRSAIVRLDRIDTLLFNAGGDYAIRLLDGRRLKVSRGRREELEQRLGLDTLGGNG